MFVRLSPEGLGIVTSTEDVGNWNPGSPVQVTLVELCRKEGKLPLEIRQITTVGQCQMPPLLWAADVLGHGVRTLDSMIFRQRSTAASAAWEWDPIASQPKKDAFFQSKKDPSVYVGFPDQGSV